MGIRWPGYIVAVAWAAGLGAPGALASVDLELRPDPDAVPVGHYVYVGLYAVSDGGTAFTAMDVVLTWDSTALELHEVLDNGPHEWDFMFGFKPDSQLDGLNDSLLDGDALFQALSFEQATATAEGFLVATFRFSTAADAPAADIVIQSALGEYSKTKVYDREGKDVTGTLGSTSVTVLSEASLSVADLTLPAGRTGDIVVSGEILGTDTFGLNIALELFPRAGNTGVAAFTPAEPPDLPSDIYQIDDVWPGTGTFDAFDTDITYSPLLNGAVDDNGTYVPGPVTFTGPLAGFPVTAGEDALGVWDIRLCTGQCTSEDSISWWELYPDRVPTGLYHGVLTVVALGDGDGSETIDARDFSELQACFTGDVGPADPPAYPSAPALRCGVYDFDDDGDVDVNDYAAFRDVMLGPAP